MNRNQALKQKRLARRKARIRKKTRPSRPYGGKAAKVVRILNTYKYAANYGFENFTNKHLCIPNTRIAIDVLARLGIKAEPLTTKVWGGGPLTTKAVASNTKPEKPDPHFFHSPEGEEEVRDFPGGGWPYHLVALVKEGERRWIVDSALQQFVGHWPWCRIIPVPKGILPNKTLQFTEDDFSIFYNAEPDNHSYDEEGGWWSSDLSQPILAIEEATRRLLRQ